ncbi:L,D-transpeptidase family protein [Parafilimonas sp.]|uniref:L,D-transpeptidase family protein n=1 Tax=Parafilimonas sp. TaxID=1969739 RepID=UPI0039E22992
MKKFLWAVFIISAAMYSCKSKHRQKAIEADQSINQKTSFNNLFIDSNTINGFLSKHPEYAKFGKQYSDFYKLRNYQCAWFDSSGMGEQAYNFMNLLASAVDTYNDSSLYNKKLSGEVDEFKTDTSHKAIRTAPDIVATELMLTGQFFMYASKIYGGSDINIRELGWFIPRKKLNLTAMLDSLIANKSDIRNSEIPLSNAYKKLLDYLAVYRKIAQTTAWDSLPYPGKAFHKGEKSPELITIKQRLFALGDLAEKDTTDVFDSSLLTGVKKFQLRMGASPDGVIGKSFIAQLNVTPAKRIEQILINLERLRWMPPVNDSTNSIVVNIPEYKMYVYDSGRLQFPMNVVVGSSATGTVIFTGNLRYIVFSPYWNVPASIVKKEILPGIARNPNYLAAHHMEQFGMQAKDVPAIRQLPGADNALGRVKFLFPNNFDIYFHDTNNHGAFNASNRNISHGCIRLSDPKKLAMYLLRYDTTYNSQTVDSLMNLDKEKWITLKKTVPVVISYYTAFVDSTGKLNFRNDIYKHDSAMAAKLFITNGNLMAVK